MAYEYFYPGTPYSLDPEYGDIFTGYHIPAGKLGAPTSIQTANQIKEVSQRLNQGVIPIEVGALNPEVFDQIPKQHFKEINRMAKLTGADISVHAPLIEASGITEHGWTEASREVAEKQLKDVVDRTAPMNEKGGMSITIHGATQTPGSEYIKTPEGKTEKMLYAVNRETGKVIALPEEEKYYPAEEGIKSVLSPRDELEALNRTEWDNSLSQIAHHIDDADARIRDSLQRIDPVILNKILKKEVPVSLLKPSEVNAYHRLQAGQQFLNDARLVLNSLFNKAYKFGTDEDRAKLKLASQKYVNEIKKVQSPIEQSNVVHNLLDEIKEIQPQIYQPSEDFALENASKTFANVALHAYEKYKDKAPAINIENFFPGRAFAYGKEMENLIKQTKKNFVEQAVKKGHSRSAAEAQADKIIGITLDVGHLNIAKKGGFEAKDIAKEVEQIAKYVKHVHMTDNFGYNDSHLPPGMGNVPIKEIMEQLEKKGFKGKQIVEAGAFAATFGAPTTYALEAMGSPMFTAKESPYWNQASGLYQGYTGGFGEMLPPVHYETFGAGFAQLPPELGGQVTRTKGGRMSGRPME